MSNSCFEDVVRRFSLCIEAGMSTRSHVRPCENVCIFGVDAAAVAGEVISDAADWVSDIEVPVIRDVRVPGWVGSGTLSIIISFTGEVGDLNNLPERLSERGSTICCVAPEGSLARDCRSVGASVVIVPAEYCGDQKLAFITGVIANLVQCARLFDVEDHLVEALRSVKVPCAYTVSDLDTMTSELSGQVMAIYSTSDVRASARWWKCLFADSGLAFCGELPEFDHNELVGWSDPNPHAPELTMVVLKGCSGPGLVGDIVECMIEVLEENGRRVMTVNVGGGSALERDLRGIMFASALHSMMGAV